MIYLDYAATAPLRPLVIEAVNELCREHLGNASSLHSAGRKARYYLESARERCAKALGARVEEVVFCSGATEADNLAILGALSHPESGHRGLITSRLEHSAVFECVSLVEEMGQPVGLIEATSEGLVDLDSLRSQLINLPGSLVSVMATNNEIGSRQPLAQVSSLCREYGALLHVDAVQDPWTAAEAVRTGWADLLAISGHKMGGLPGGALYVRQGVPIGARIVGGAQEDRRRAGTSAVIAAAALAIALEETLAEQDLSVVAARDALEGVLKKIPEALRLGPQKPEERAEHISSWVFGELPAEPILAQLDLRGVCASSGSACSSHAIEPSRVVQAIGLSERAKGLVRFSMGWMTTIDDTIRAAEIVGETVEAMRVKGALG